MKNNLLKTLLLATLLFNTVNNVSYTMEDNSWYIDSSSQSVKGNIPNLIIQMTTNANNISCFMEQNQCINKDNIEKGNNLLQECKKNLENIFLHSNIKMLDWYNQYKHIRYKYNEKQRLKLYNEIRDIQKDEYDILNNVYKNKSDFSNKMQVYSKEFEEKMFQIHSLKEKICQNSYELNIILLKFRYANKKETRTKLLSTINKKLSNESKLFNERIELLKILRSYSSEMKNAFLQSSNLIETLCNSKKKREDIEVTMNNLEHTNITLDYRDIQLSNYIDMFLTLTNRLNTYEQGNNK